MSETALRAAIVEALNASGMVYVWHAQAGKVRVARGWMQLAPKGTPDIIGYGLRGQLAGRFVGIEVKVPGGTTDRARRASQAAAHEHIARHGGLAAQVRSVEEALRAVLP